MNNRKQTSAGAREFRQRPLEIVIGFTIKAALTDEDGKKTNNPFKAFIPINRPKHNIDGKSPINVQKRIKRQNWDDAISHAKKEAYEMAGSKDFRCNVFPKIMKTAIGIKQW